MANLEKEDICGIVDDLVLTILLNDFGTTRAPYPESAENLRDINFSSYEDYRRKITDIIFEEIQEKTWHTSSSHNYWIVRRIFSRSIPALTIIDGSLDEKIENIFRKYEVTYEYDSDDDIADMLDDDDI